MPVYLFSFLIYEGLQKEKALSAKACAPALCWYGAAASRRRPQTGLQAAVAASAAPFERGSCQLLSLYVHANRSLPGSDSFSPVRPWSCSSYRRGEREK